MVLPRRSHVRFAAATAAVIAAVGGAVVPLAAHGHVLGASLTLVLLWLVLVAFAHRLAADVRDREVTPTTGERYEAGSSARRQQDTLEAVSRLAGGVAHDFGNLLLAINGYSEFLADSLVDERERRFAAEIRAAGERAATLTQQLLAFSRRQALEPCAMNLNDAVAQIEPMLRRLTGDGVRLGLDLDPALPAVEVDRAQIDRVLMNLALNAREAIGGPGTIEIRTRADAGGVVLEVSDSGTGMDDETRARIFEPFFTTKLSGHGTGLGLSSAHGIVVQSGGTMSVRSAKGEGTTFTIRFPTDGATARPDRLT